MPNFATPKQCRVPVHCWCNIMTHLKSRMPENFTERALVSRCSRLFSLPQQCPAAAITNRITWHGNTKWLWTAVSGYTQPTLILIRVQRAAAQQNFLLKTLVTDRQSAPMCHRSRPVSLKADGCGHVSSVKESVRCAWGKHFVQVLFIVLHTVIFQFLYWRL